MTPADKFNTHVFITITDVALRFQKDSGYSSYRLWANYVHANMVNKVNMDYLNSMSFPIVKRLIGVFSFTVDEAMDYIVQYFGNKIYEDYINYANELSRLVNK